MTIDVTPSKYAEFLVNVDALHRGEAVIVAAPGQDLDSEGPFEALTTFPNSRYRIFPLTWTHPQTNEVHHTANMLQVSTDGNVTWITVGREFNPNNPSPTYHIEDEAWLRLHPDAVL